MKYAVVAATAGGCRQALRICQVLEDSRDTAWAAESVAAQGADGIEYQLLRGQVDIYVHAKAAGDMDTILAEERAAGRGYAQYQRLADLLPNLWQSYDGLVCIMATGIVVRLIAPHIVSKLSDPAVLVMDDRGQNIISLLSGHMGGANRLTAYLAGRLSAHAVITTATDVNQLLAPDVVAGHIQAVPYPKENIVKFNGGLLRGENISYWLEESLPDSQSYARILQAKGIAYRKFCLRGLNAASMEEFQPNDAKKSKDGTLPWQQPGLHVIIGQENEGLPRQDNLLYLHPRKLVAGVGCRRDTDKALILSALEKAIRSIGWGIGRISSLASTVVKADEQGLLAAAQELGVDIEFYANPQLAQKIEEYHLPESAFVKKTIGVGNICQAAALCRAGRGSIALDKTKYEKVTVALVWQK